MPGSLVKVHFLLDDKYYLLSKLRKFRNCKKIRGNYEHSIIVIVDFDNMHMIELIAS